MIAITLVFVIGQRGISAGESEPSLLQVHELVVQLPGKVVQINFVQFSQDAFNLVVIDNAERGVAKYRNLEEAIVAINCLAGINGGFFERSPFDPVGLMVSRGIVSGSLQRKSWINGIVAVRRGVPLLSMADTFVLDGDVSDAIQAGPMLVQDAKLVGGPYSGRIADRTFICRSTDGIWGLGVAGPCTLSELGSLLLGNEVTALMKIDSALNLDGGPSTAFWATKENGAIYKAEKWPVRNFVGVIRRKCQPSLKKKPEKGVKP